MNTILEQLTLASESGSRFVVQCLLGWPNAGGLHVGGNAAPAEFAAV